MSDVGQSNSERPFATFRGELSGVRAARLFRQQPLLKRCLTALILVLFVTGICAAMWWLFGRTGDRRISNDIAIIIVWPFTIWCALRLQSSSYRGRTWAQINRLFCGPYEASLYDKHLDVRSSGIAQRFQYLTLSPRRIQASRTYSRVAFELLEMRVLLLPVEDCQPQRTAQEVAAFLQEHIRTAQSNIG